MGVGQAVCFNRFAGGESTDARGEVGAVEVVGAGRGLVVVLLRVVTAKGVDG